MQTDAGIEDYIMQVYHFSQSNPYPEQWIADCRKELADEQSGLWMEFLLQDLKRQAAELRIQMEDASDICRDDEFLCAYEPAFLEDVFLLTFGGGRFPCFSRTSYRSRIWAAGCSAEQGS